MSMLEDIGGETSLRDLVEHFYDLVETLPEGSNLRRLHARGHGVEHARVEQRITCLGQVKDVSSAVGPRHAENTTLEQTFSRTWEAAKCAYTIRTSEKYRNPSRTKGATFREAQNMPLLQLFGAIIRGNRHHRTHEIFLCRHPMFCQRAKMRHPHQKLPPGPQFGSLFAPRGYGCF